MAASAVRAREAAVGAEQERVQALRDALLELQEQVAFMTKQQQQQLISDERLVDLGGGIMFVRARPTDASRICVDIGAGVLVDLSLEEAHEVIQKRLDEAEGRIGTLIEERARLLAEAQVVEDALRTLQDGL
jgi:prefoldin alpha subunit